MSKYIGCLASITRYTSLGLMNKLSFITNCFSLFFSFLLFSLITLFAFFLFLSFLSQRTFSFFDFIFSFYFQSHFYLILTHLTWRQRWENYLFTFMQERISICDPIMDNISIILPRSPKQHMSSFHGNHITKHIINILSKENVSNTCSSHPISTIISPPPLHHTSIILDDNNSYHVSRIMLQNENFQVITTQIPLLKHGYIYDYN